MNSIPVNEYGCVDVEDLPEGLLHISIPYIGRVCKANNIPYAKALTSIDRIRGRYVPVFEGIVIFASDERKLIDALPKSKSKSIIEYFEQINEISAIVKKQFPGVPDVELEGVSRCVWGNIPRKYYHVFVSIEECYKIRDYIRDRFTSYGNLLVYTSYSTIANKCRSFKKESRAKDRDTEFEKVSGQVTEIYLEWKTGRKPTLEEAILKKIEEFRSFEKANMAELVFRFSHRDEEEVKTAVRKLLDSGKILAVQTEGDPSTIIFVPASKAESEKELAA